MASHSWIFDAPTGTYKSHMLTMDLYRETLARSIFLEHVTERPALGRGAGETVTVKRINAINEPAAIAAAQLAEDQRIPEVQFTFTTKGITVKEWGQKVPYTSLSEDLGQLNMQNEVQRALVNQLRLVQDTAAATAMKRTPIKYALTGATSNNVTTNGVFGAASTVNLSPWHIEEIRELMFDTYLVPPVDGTDDYVGIFRSLALKAFRQHSDFAEWHKYIDPFAKFNGETGKYEGVRLIETNHNAALGKVGTSSVLGEGVVFGDQALAYVEAVSPELRMPMPGDGGRDLSVLWYGVMEYDIIFDTANSGEAKIIHVGST